MKAKSFAAAIAAVVLVLLWAKAAFAAVVIAETSIVTGPNGDTALQDQLWGERRN